jgi:hypothetical protein
LTHLTAALLSESLTYAQFMALTAQLVEEKRTTGADQSEAYQEYTRMSLQRMLRWNKTAKVSEPMQALMKSITRPQVWLVITEAWCGDGAQSIPYFAKLAELNPLITLRFLFRDEHPELMDAYLTNGNRSIPKLVATTADLQHQLFTWGPKPQYLMELLAAFKKNPGERTYPALLEEMHGWYAKNKHQDLEAELIPLLTSTLNR